jgi:hypothetical protein
MDEDELRALVDDLLKTETDQKLVQKLMQYRYDAMLEGTEAEKNAALSPALAVPDLDKEVLLAQGKRVGMSPTESQRIEPTKSAPPEKPPAPASKPSLTRRPTQDEVMGYHDDDDDDFMPDDDMPYM